MFKKRVRNANARTRPVEDGTEPVAEGDTTKKLDGSDQEQDVNIGLDDILALRKFRRTHQGIDATKLTKGELKRKRAVAEDGEADAQPGLRKPMKNEIQDDEADPEDEEAVTRKLVRSNNFTQQTNALDVDKHMMDYIEKELQRRRGDDDKTARTEPEGPYDPYAELFRVDPKYRIQKKTEEEEGNVTNSMAMLTAIPEVDLGMETRLRNIEETEKAKRLVSETKGKRKTDEDDLIATRFRFRPTQERQSPAEALMSARLEAQGFAPSAPKSGPRQGQQVATDEFVMERFKKRMRK